MRHAIRPTRRQLIQAGLASLGPMSLPGLLRLRAEQGQSPLDTAVIFVLQEGGATQFETYDPKPNAPVEYRGEFGAIRTSVPGVSFSEAMPRQAAVMHKMAILRSIHHPSTQHSSSVHLVKTGYYCRADSNENEMPAVGAYAARIRGANRVGMPPYVLIHSGERYDGGHFLGQGYNPCLVRSNNERAGFEFPNTSLLDGISNEQFDNRRDLLARLDETRRLIDTRGIADSMDVFRRQAYDMVTSPHARRAFQIESEPHAVRQKYGLNPLGQRMLLARRLVEHGVTFLTVGTMPWDHHGDLWRDMRRDGPMFDQAMAALIDDLDDRGLNRRVLVVAMGEFGREPRITTINGAAPGRDHWGAAMSIAMAGGDVPRGLVVGATDPRGGLPTESPYRVECVIAHIYRHLGIDPALTFPDFTGRPRSLLEVREPIRELI